MRRHFIFIAVVALFTVAVAGPAAAGDNDKVVIDEIIEYEADEVWTDPVGHEQACGFEVRVDDYMRFNWHVFDDREIYNVKIRSTYTNLGTGFSFEDFASYQITHDFETGYAVHRGAFWRIRVPGTGMVVLDVGQFVQDWNYWTILPDTLKGANHDANGPYAMGELPEFSYCGLMAEDFPER
jgi:hypothetical protein